MKLDNIIYEFCSTDNIRRMGHPINNEGNIIATNGHMLIIAPSKYFDGAYEAYTTEYPNYKGIIPIHEKDTILEQDSKVILDELLLLPINDIYTECEHCEGEGYLFTHNSNKRVCSECYGDKNDEYLGRLIPSIRNCSSYKNKVFVISINDVLFNPNLLLCIYRVAKSIIQPVKWVKIEKNKACIAYIDDIMILINPLDLNEIDIEELGDKLTIVNIPSS